VISTRGQTSMTVAYFPAVSATISSTVTM